ncbi:MAG: response regulator [candidate division FCPU426 bacterium]
MSKRHILFVDDEPNILQGIRRMFRPLREEWEIETAESGEQALALLDQSPFDVIVSDMRMPGMDGVRLLTEVMKRHPQIIRLVLSGHSDQESILRSVGPTHQYLTKPCDAETLKNTIDRACSLQSLLGDEKLRRTISQIQSLPSLPALYTEVLTELRSPEASIEKIGHIISRDAGMTAKLLQLVNSAFFGFYSHVNDAMRAVTILGLDKIRSLVLSIHVFTSLIHSEEANATMNAYWKHNLMVGSCAKRIAQDLKQSKPFQEEALMAGMLHDTGKFIMLAKLHDQYEEIVQRARANNCTQIECEYEIMGASHAEIGAYLLGLWGLPTPIVEAVAFHHQPQLSKFQQLAPLTIVHIADAILRKLQPLEPLDPIPVDVEYLQQLGLADQMPRWEADCENFIGTSESF